MYDYFRGQISFGLFGKISFGLFGSVREYPVGSSRADKWPASWVANCNMLHHNNTVLLFFCSVILVFLGKIWGWEQFLGQGRVKVFLYVLFGLVDLLVKRGRTISQSSEMWQLGWEQYPPTDSLTDRAARGCYKKKFCWWRQSLNNPATQMLQIGKFQIISDSCTSLLAAFSSFASNL